MLDHLPPSADLAPGLAHWWATEAHPVPPAAGSYVVVDQAPLLSAAALGPISAVLVLLRAEDPESRWLRGDDSTAVR